MNHGCGCVASVSHSLNGQNTSRLKMQVATNEWRITSSAIKFLEEMKNRLKLFECV